MRTKVTPGRMFFIIVLFFFLCFLYSVLKIATDSHPLVPSSKTIPKEYEGLFNVNDSNITEKQSHIFRKTNSDTVCNFMYANKYWIVITKLKTKLGEKGLPIIHRAVGTTGTSEGYVYTGFTKVYFDFMCSVDLNYISNLYLTLQGDSIQYFNNSDSLKIYSLKMKAFSVKYKQDGKVVMLMDNKDFEIPSQIVFLKHNNSSYFVFISTFDRNNKLNPNLIYKLINTHNP